MMSVVNMDNDIDAAPGIQAGLEICGCIPSRGRNGWGSSDAEPCTLRILKVLLQQAEIAFL